MELDFIFQSSDHIRYERGRHVSGPHGGAKRAVKVEPNISGHEGYSVTIYNMDGNHPLWQNNIQMAPKRMKIIKSDSKKIELQGYGFDSGGTPFSNYGLTVEFEGAEVQMCILHIHDRRIDIEYLK
ncbi:MAG: hypothetical protein PHU97_09890 [Bacteroidales bacterium]|nr:hypothetical protein [Bacteroidales bacterium]MDD3960503.1 hypothetical protein [Bacteroidales bacterium]